MPYTAFHTTAEEVGYDIELLSARFGVGFETVCHRLSTLQRTGHRGGVPFSFLRVDRAGNISKRQSASDFHFSRLGGTCPLWTVYEAFSRPAGSSRRSRDAGRQAVLLGRPDHHARRLRAPRAAR